MMRAVFFLGLIISGFAMADEAVPLLYSRDRITIVPQSTPAIQLAPAPGETLTQTPPPVPHVFDVEVRDALVLYRQEGWFNLSSPSETEGTLLAFSAPTIAPIQHAEQYSPLDILLIDPQGKIIQIIPSIRLSELNKEIYPEKGVLAFLFLQGGICEKLAIRPGDEVEHALFKKPPTVLNVAPPAPPLAPATITSSPPPSAPPAAPVVDPYAPNVSIIRRNP
jgi:uncharacterized protein